MTKARDLADLASTASDIGNIVVEDVMDSK
jgi:hypothetical protein